MPIKQCHACEIGAMLKCCYLLSNILLLTTILILRLSTFMMVSHQEASGIAAEDASSKPWMTKHSHLHVQEEVKVMQMMGDDKEVNVMEPKLWSKEITCKYRHRSPRIKKYSTTPSLQTQLTLSTAKYSFMLCITSVISKN